MNDNHDITILNTLIATTLDSMKGYREAAEDSETANAKFFSDMAAERSAVATALQSQVASLGGNPEDDSSTMGAVHRGFMKLKELVVSRDEKAIINEVERGEDYIKAKFETALGDDRLSMGSRSIVEQAMGSIRAGHDRMSAMKHAMT